MRERLTQPKGIAKQNAGDVLEYFCESEEVDALTDELRALYMGAYRRTRYTIGLAFCLTGEIVADFYDDFQGWLAGQDGRQYELHDTHVNSAFVKMLRTIGFDKGYVRGGGCYLWDKEGNKYLDLLTGWGVFALGRNHP